MNLRQIELINILSEKIKENVTVTVEKKDLTKEDIAEKINELSEEDKKEILNLLKAKKKKDVQ